MERRKKSGPIGARDPALRLRSTDSMTVKNLAGSSFRTARAKVDCKYDECSEVALRIGVRLYRHFHFRLTAASPHEELHEKRCRSDCSAVDTQPEGCFCFHGESLASGTGLIHHLGRGIEVRVYAGTPAQVCESPKTSSSRILLDLEIEGAQVSLGGFADQLVFAFAGHEHVGHHRAHEAGDRRNE